jgi:hypothetical protein
VGGYSIEIRLHWVRNLPRSLVHEAGNSAVEGTTSLLTKKTSKFTMMMNTKKLLQRSIVYCLSSHIVLPLSIIVESSPAASTHCLG